jgi:hypothetical protein
MSAMPDLGALEAQVDDQLGDLLAAARDALKQLLKTREELDRKIAVHQRRLLSWEAAKRSLEGRAGAPRVLGVVPPTKREAVLALLAETPDAKFKLIEIRTALIQRGWMKDGQAHALEVAVTDMERRKEIRRVRRGIYTLTPTDENGV